MSASLPMQRFDSLSDTALKAATRFWFVVAVIGQLLFGFAVTSFYGLTALRGDLNRWGRFVAKGHIPGDAAGNLAFTLHVFAAGLLMLSGAVQLVPAVRSRFPAFHRWNGRAYMVAAVAGGAAGLYLLWVRKTPGSLLASVGTSLSAVLIWVFAAQALRTAMARDFRSHRVWALRLFLVVSANFFLRTGFLFSVMAFGSTGFNPTQEGPFAAFLAFAQYLVPLGVLELYLRAQDRAGAWRLGTAALLVVLTLAMGVGMLGVTRILWARQIQAAFDPRRSVVESLSVTLASQGIDAATDQYRRLRASDRANLNFDEGELNSFGYQLLRAQKLDEAVRIFGLNVEAFPASSNAYDSLGEAYMAQGDKHQAIANYRKSLELDPRNANGAHMLKELEAR